MRALNENEDWNVYAEIKGTADRNQRKPPPTPNYTKTRGTSDGIAYSGYIKRERVCWFNNILRKFKVEQYMARGGYADTWADDFWPNPSRGLPLDPYAYAWAESEWGDYIGGSVNTDVGDDPWDEN